MKEYTYPFFYRFIYRYGNIPLTIFLVLYLIPVVFNIDSNELLLIPLIITLFIIYFLNKQYLILYKIIPYRIVVTDNKIICDKFLFSDKVLEISFKDISALKGGIFNGRKNGVMTITSINNFTVGFYSSIRNAKELETIILKNVRSEIYDEIAARLGVKSGDGVKK